MHKNLEKLKENSNMNTLSDITVDGSVYAKSDNQTFDKISSDYTTRIIGGDRLSEDHIMIFTGEDDIRVRYMHNNISQEISNFIRDYNDLMRHTKLQNLIKSVENQFWSNKGQFLAFLYVDEINISTEFQSFVLNNVDMISTLLSLKSPLIEDMNIHQFETFYSNYLLRSKTVIESIKLCWVRVAYAISAQNTFIQNYNALSAGQISVSSVIYKRAGTKKAQYISCFLATPDNNMYSIVQTLRDLSLASKHGGGVGISLNRLRSVSEKSGIKFAGVGPWLELYANILNIRMRHFKKGAVSLYLPFYHKDIYTFLNSIDEENTHNVTTLTNKIGVYINNIFLDAVLTDSDIYLFNPDDFPNIINKHGDDFYSEYLNIIRYDPRTITVKARNMLTRICKSIIEFGGPYILNLDAMNLMCNQRKYGLVVSNLCTEITEVADNGNIACCNLGQLPLHMFFIDGVFRYDLLAQRSRQMVRNLNHVIDTTYYPICEEVKKYEDSSSIDIDILSDIFKSYDLDVTNEVLICIVEDIFKTFPKSYPDKDTNLDLRPIGIGISGLFTLFGLFGIDYSNEESKQKCEVLTNKIMACIYFNVIFESCQMAVERGHGFKEEELFQFDLKQEYRESIQNSKYLSDEFKEKSATFNQGIPIPEPEEWGQDPIYLRTETEMIKVSTWDDLKFVCEQFGRLNSLLTALMPTATNSLIFGGSEAFDPKFSNIYNNVSGNNTIISINKYLKKDLIKIGWYKPEVLQYIEENGGSIRGLSNHLDSTILDFKDHVIIEQIENKYWTSCEIPHNFHARITHILSHYVDQSCSYNMYLDDYENDLYPNIMQRGLMGRKTILYYLRMKSDSKSMKSGLCIDCMA